jgi:hypothetical protein
MHRSGTSLLSKALHYLGVEMADDTDHASDKNPAGFWERPELVALHDEILGAIGRPVGSPLHSLPFPPGWWRDKAVLPFRARLRDYLDERRGATLGWWGFKDPRTCRVLPLWLETFSQMGIEARFVWAIRSPAEAAASMAAKNPALRPISIAQSEMMWLAYNYDILRYYHVLNHPLVVSYDEWFEDPLRAARRLVCGHGLPGFVSESEFADCIHNIVQPSYRRHRDGELAPPSVPLTQWLYSDIASGRLATADRDGPEIVERHLANLDMMFRAAVPFAPLLEELPKLRERVQAAEEEAVACRAADAERQETLAQREAAIVQRDAALAKRGAAVAALDAAIAARDAVIAERDACLARREAELSDRDRRIRELEQELGAIRARAKVAARNAAAAESALREQHAIELQRLLAEFARVKGLEEGR